MEGVPTRGEASEQRMRGMRREITTMDGNTAVAHVAYRVNEVCAIYPITPSSTMAELADEWSALGLKNIWGNMPVVQEMQSEGGAAGAVHGALQSGALTTTFTSSQGLMLMLPNMYKIAGELTATVFHVAARSLATQALSIFGDHSDVMAARSTGFALLSSASVQEAHDNALIAQAATLETRVPFLHFFDGFRTSHEVNTLALVGDEDIRAMIDQDLVRAHRERALDPEHPFVRGTAQNPDTFFQAREAVNPYYARVPAAVQSVMDRFARLTDRQYHLFDYTGPPGAERVVVAMGSGAETVRETAAALGLEGEKVGALQVRLYRPFSGEAFVAALPQACRALAVIEQTKEPGATGEPLYLDVVASLVDAVAAGRRSTMPRVIGGRYGLSSKDFNPAMAKAVFDELKKPRGKNGFTVGIDDDVAHTSLDYDPTFAIEPDDVVRAMFYGLGADGTVGANKNTVKIIAEEAGRHAQGYFVYEFAQVGSADGVASALRAASHKGALSHPAGELRGLPPIQFHHASGRAADGCSACHLPPQQPLWAGGGVGPAAPLHAAADHRQEAALLRHRCVQGGTGGRPQGAHQHHPADLLLRPLRRAAEGGGDRADQGGDPQELCREGRGGGAAEFQGGRRRARASFRSEGARRGDEPVGAGTARAGRRARVRPPRHGQDARRPGRRDSREPDAGRRHFPLRHRRVREAQHRRRRAGVGSRYLHPVRPLRFRLPARGHPRQILRIRQTGRSTRELQVGAHQRARLPGRALLAAVLRRRLHRLRALRRGLPGA